jgi:tripartite-type tricarboxylate transporter receptor subunit TctC
MHKTTPFSRWRRLGLLALLGATASVPALAQKAGDKWPERPVRLVVNFAPGGAADVLARAITPTMSQVLGQSVVVDN